MKKVIIIGLVLAGSFAQAQWAVVKNFDFIPGTAFSGFNSEHIDDIYQVNDSTVLCSFGSTTCCSSGYSDETLFRTSDYGTSWSMVDYYTTGGLLSVPWYFDALSTRDSIIRTNITHLQLSTDMGLTWDTLPFGTFSFSDGIYNAAFDFLDLNHGLLWNSGSQQLYLFLNGSATVLPYTDSIPSSIKMVSPARAFMICDNGNKLMVTNDTGATWSTALDVAPVFNYIEFPDTLTGYLSCSGGAVYKTMDGGLTWIALSTPTLNNLECSAFLNDTLGFFAGSNGTILRTRDGGTIWSDQSMSWAGSVKKITVSSAAAYCSADHTFIYRNQNLNNLFEPQKNDIRFSIYPNPVKNYFIITNPDSQHIRSVRIFNVMGQCELNQEVSTFSNQVHINVAALPPGLKTVLIEGEKNYYSCNLIQE